MVGPPVLPNLDVVAGEGRDRRALERVGAEDEVLRTSTPWRRRERETRSAALGKGVERETSVLGATGVWRGRWVFLT